MIITQCLWSIAGIENTIGCYLHGILSGHFLSTCLCSSTSLFSFTRLFPVHISSYGGWYIHRVYYRLLNE